MSLLNYSLNYCPISTTSDKNSWMEWIPIENCYFYCMNMLHGDNTNELHIQPCDALNKKELVYNNKTLKNGDNPNKL